MILRAAVLSGFLLLSEVAFAQRPHENGSPPPPPPTATSSPNPSPSPIAPHSTSSGISPTTGPFSPPAHGSNASPPAGNAGHARKSAWQENGIGVFPRTGGDPNPLRLKREPLPDLMPKHCKREPCTQPPPTHPVGGNAQPAPPRAAAAPAQRCPPGQTPQGGACVTAIVGQCQPGQVWNGIVCDQPGDKCTTFRSRAETIRTEAFGVSSQMKTACMKNPNGKACTELTQEHDMIVLRYRSLLNEAPAACRATLPDPLTL